jgi:hypothetical protein
MAVAIPTYLISLHNEEFVVQFMNYLLNSRVHSLTPSALGLLCNEVKSTPKLLTDNGANIAQRAALVE